MVQIKLTMCHTHGGKTYPAGDVIEVDEQSAVFIVANKIGQKINQEQILKKTGAKNGKN